MSRNPLAAEAVAILRAAQAAGYKPHHMREIDGGFELTKPNRPVLILTYANARAFNQMIEEERA